MDGAKLQSKVYSGYAKAAQRIGLPYDVHRPVNALDPLANKVATLPAHFRAGVTYETANKYGVAAWYGTLDGTQVAVGDYLVGPQGTFFIAAKQALLPILIVECNRTLSIKRPQQQTGVGAAGYGGNTLSNETPLMSGWPASVLQGTKGEKNETNLPGDVRTPWWLILLPAYGDIVLNSGDTITDDLGRRYVVSSAEWTDLGWRLSAMQAQA